MKRLAINQDILKIIALVTMTCDHLRHFIDVPQAVNAAMYLVGRTAFPIFAYLMMLHLAQMDLSGYKKYLMRLGYFGVLSFFIFAPIHGLFDVSLALPFNILISFWIAVAALYLIYMIENSPLNTFIKYVLLWGVIAIAGGTSVLSDYGFAGFCFILCFYFYFRRQTPDWIVFCLIFSAMINESWGGVVSLITTIGLLLFVYPVSEPRLLRRWWIFYVYYPLHIVLIACATYLLDKF